MFYRETGQFKTSYQADQAIFPIAQDRWFVIGLVAFAFLGVPLFAGQYLYTEVLIPVLILSIAAIGLNLLLGWTIIGWIWALVLSLRSQRLVVTG